MDADEMTADPVFVFDADTTQDVASTRVGISEEAQNAFSGDVTRRTLVLDDGRRIALADVNDFDALTTLATPAALLIEDFSSTGEPEVVADFTEAAAAD